MLTIEDGTNVTNADSFITLQECRDYAESRGFTDLPSDDTQLESLIRIAADYINSIEHKFQGYRYFYADGQALSFPREDIYLHGRYIGGEIPSELKNAQAQLTIDAFETGLLTSGDGQSVTKEQIGPLVVEYSDNGDTNTQTEPTAALAILKPFFTLNSNLTILNMR